MCESTPPWDDLDPGIVGVVRALWDAGFRTTDSGDGKHKATLGWSEEEWTPWPHVVIRVDADQVGQAGIRLAEWGRAHGLDDIEVQASLFEDEGVWRWVLFLSGESLFGWTG